MARYIDADALIKDLSGRLMKEVFPDWDWLPSPTKNRVGKLGGAFKVAIEQAPTVDAIPIDTVAEMLADLFGDECCCNYNGIDEWLSPLCEHSETCPDAIGKHGCWKQFIKHWQERSKENAAD